MSPINSFVKCNDESFWLSSKCHRKKSDGNKKHKKREDLFVIETVSSLSFDNLLLLSTVLGRLNVDCGLNVDFYQDAQLDDPDNFYHFLR
jgi:hypothetical protein